MKEGYSLDDMPLGVQRGIAREILKQKRAAASSPAGGLPDLPDALLTQLLADPDMRAQIDAMGQQAGLPPLDEQPEEMQKRAAALFAMLQAGGEEGGD